MNNHKFIVIYGEHDPFIRYCHDDDEVRNAINEIFAQYGVVMLGDLEIIEIASRKKMDDFFSNL
ncbi:hypothetical protein ABGV42_00340 [Paenibacillus pabuli]|uniref:hypothetical protein n=1 Tax=Paenibacillus pabuli TaxID=1472 RepID=UPI003241C96F